MAKTRSFTTADGRIHEIAENFPNVISALESGDLTTYSTNVLCNGEQKRIDGKLVNQIMEAASYSIEIFQTPIIVKEDKIIDPVQHITLQGANIKDKGHKASKGTYFWSPPTKQLECKLRKLNQIKATQVNYNGDPYLIDTNKEYFIKTTTETKTICGLTAFGTDYTDIFVIDSNTIGDTVLERIEGTNMNLFTFINLKNDFLYYVLRNMVTSNNRQKDTIIEQAITTQMDQHKIYQISTNSFFIASGDLIYTFQCPIVTLPALDNSPQSCTSELAVDDQGTTKYMQPITHILTPSPTTIQCGSHFAPAYKSQNGQWYTQSPQLTKTHTPEFLPKLLNLTQPLYRSSKGEQYPRDVLQEFGNLVRFGHTKTDVVNKMVFLTCPILNQCEYTPHESFPTYHDIYDRAVTKLGNYTSPKEFLTWLGARYSTIITPIMQLAFTFYILKKTLDLCISFGKLKKHGLSTTESLKKAVFSEAFLLDVAHA